MKPFDRAQDRLRGIEEQRYRNKWRGYTGGVQLLVLYLQRQQPEQRVERQLQRRQRERQQ